MDDDRVFKALANRTRRRLLDLLFRRDGRSLKDLTADVDRGRCTVMKHLNVLKRAGLVVTKRSGRETHHFLNAIPIHLIQDRWIHKYAARQLSALARLKAELETPS